ncbi:flavin-containing monooxygenase [Microbispora amethystogenes]|uniref:Oxidoreductase n=1 Tax=Microbispora amethystogenes TaxID=1427754 RepID=A0ABQ4FMH1_9ACTN|nr:NAD(P)-binding domain-containing protein [Microbispora amethystogenes]GIH35943.1 oxidoreductase [Microbispora amethystogenes]
MSSRPDYDTLIVGGGQAGLALGYHLRRAGLRFAILDANKRVGDAWRHRWDSLTLFTPRRYDALPGLPFPGDPDGHPGKDEVAAYLEEYVRRFALPVRLEHQVTAVRPYGERHGESHRERDGDGFRVETTAGSCTAARVVVAAGAFHTPRTPDFASGLAPEVVQVHSSAYRRPEQLPMGEVLVVGAGNTGVQIAEELAGSGRRVRLSAPSLGLALPQRMLGRDLFWWFSRLGFMDVRAGSRLGRRLRGRPDMIIGMDVKRLMRRVERVERVVGAEGPEVLLAGGRRLRPGAVVWATGFRPHYPWLHVPVLDERGAPMHQEGVTEWPGLYFLGLPWQSARGSSVLGWIGRDAAALAGRLTTSASQPGKSLIAP